MRKPNGYGSIKKLSGNRRRPYVFVVSVNGKQKPVEYFPTQFEAEIFAADYNRVHILDTVIVSGTACVLPSIGNTALPHCLSSNG